MVTQRLSRTIQRATSLLVTRLRGLAICLLVSMAMPAGAALLPFDPAVSGELHESASLGSTPSQPLNFFYRNETGLEALQFSSEFGFAPPPHTTGDFGHRNHGYLIYDISVLNALATSAYLEFELTAQGGGLGDLLVTHIRRLTPAELAALPTGRLRVSQGRSLMSDLATPALGRLGLRPGSDIFQVPLVADGLAEINASAGLVAFGLAYETFTPEYNARVEFSAAPRLYIEALSVPAPGTYQLLFPAIILLITRKAGRQL